MLTQFQKRLGNTLGGVLLASTIAASGAFALEGPFIPPNGQQLMVIGQDTISIDDYKSQVGLEPAGVTTYIDLGALGGLINGVDNGGGPNNAGYLQANYPNSIHAIAVYIKGVQDAAASGQLDNQMNEMVRILKSWERPVLLRFGYEADGAWNSNEPDTYIKAFRRMHDAIEAADADNIALVWQVATYCGGTYKGLPFTSWYPGDDVVDWLGMSYFTPQDCGWSAVNGFIDWAKTKNKPVMIAESASQRYDLQVGTYNPHGQRKVADQTKTGQQIWDEWFVNYFKFIEDHKDIIKVAAYINADWDSQSLWQSPYLEGYWGDTRVQMNTTVLNNWKQEVTTSNWIPASPSLFNTLKTGAGSTDTDTDTGTGTSTGTGTVTDTDTSTGTDTGTGVAGDYVYIVHKATGKKASTCGPINSEVAVVSGDVTDQCAQWEKVATGNYFYLRSVAADGYIRPRGLSNGVPIKVHPTDWTGNYMQWSFESTNDGFGYLVNRQTKKYMYANNGDALLQESKKWKGDWTRWQFVDVPGSTSTSTGTSTGTGTNTSDDGSRGAFGSEYSSSSAMTVYHEDNNWSAGFVYLCLDGSCQVPTKSNGYYEYTFSNVNEGQQYSVEFKVQDSAAGQCLSGVQTVTHKQGGEMLSTSCD